MPNSKYELSDINESVIELTDKYIKAVIGKSKIKQIQRFECKKKGSFIVYRLEGFEEDLIYEDSSFENFMQHHFYVNEFEFFIRNDNLAKALLHLTEIQRDVLFQTEVMERTQRDIAKEYGISFQMVSKYRKAALKRLREELCDEKE